MTRIIQQLFSAALLILFPLITFAWSAIGHMVIAHIAYENITPKAQDKIEKLIGYFHNEYADINSFIQIVTWPDSIRSQKIEMFTHWHYIDIPLIKESATAPDIIDDDNAIWALGHVTNVVKNERANNYERARFLAFFAHIVSDLHQPLHTVSYVSANFPKGDQGGNLYQIRIHGERTKLHRLWDNGVGVLAGNNSPENIRYLANRITTLYPKSFFRQINDLNPNDWVTEGMENAKKYVYAVPENQNADEHYIEKGQQIAEQEIALAGYRLAALLNQIFN